MKHILFILGSYYPYYSAVGKCVGNIADVFSAKSDTYQVSVICCMSRPNQPSIEHYKNQTIIRISTPYIRARERVEGKIQRANGINKKMLSIWHQCLRAYGVCRIVFASNSLQKDLVKAYLSAINNLQEKPDIIIPSCTPFETIISALEYKEEKPEVAVVPMLFDKFADSETLHRFAWNKKLKMHTNCAKEMRMLKEAAHTFYMPTWHEYLNEKYPIYLDHTTAVEHPLIIRPQSPSHVCDEIDGRAKMIFAGSLIRGYVEPDYVLKLAGQQAVFERLQITFYATGTAVAEIQETKSECVKVNGWVSKPVLEKAIIESDICLSIAEINGKQISSKIFEYMSFGKPIVHIYTSEDDVNLQYINRYPLALCLKVKPDCIVTQAETLAEWCYKNKGKLLDFAEVQKLFFNCTPEYIQSTIERKISEL